MAVADVLVDKDQRKIVSGEFIFYLVQDGFYRLDGGTMYGMVPKPIWEKIDKHDEKNRLYMTLNCLLAKRDDQVFLVDAGIGDKLDERGREIFGIEKDKNLIGELADAGVTPDMVTHVVITHMHLDHVGWITDNDGKIMFPNAKYFIQMKEWEEALNPHVRFKNTYLIPYYEALKDSPNLVLLDGDTEIEENVWALLVPGHSRGHQIAFFDAGKVKIVHMGDIVPIASLVCQNWTCGFDNEPEVTINNKLPILDRAYRENWLVMTAHDIEIRVGELEMVKGKYQLKKMF